MLVDLSNKLFPGVTMLNVTWYEYGDHQHNFQNMVMNI